MGGGSTPSADSSVSVPPPLASSFVGVAAATAAPLSTPTPRSSIACWTAGGTLVTGFFSSTSIASVPVSDVASGSDRGTGVQVGRPGTRRDRTVGINSCVATPVGKFDTPRVEVISSTCSPSVPPSGGGGTEELCSPVPGVVTNAGRGEPVICPAPKPTVGKGSEATIDTVAGVRKAEI